MVVDIVLVSLLGGGFGAILAIAGRNLAVETDPRIDSISSLLPGANCGSCGYPGCSGLAKAITDEEADASRCSACSAEARQQIAHIMGRRDDSPADPGLRKIARLACSGRRQTPYEYNGIKNCHLAARYLGSPGMCNFGCYGFGSCAKACPFHAIVIDSSGLPVVDPALCVGCGICVQQCPQQVLYLSSAKDKIHLKCNNREKGKAAMVVCPVSCISCGICVRSCPNQAISLSESENGSLPVIDYSKCSECGLCISKCTRHCLAFLDPIGITAPSEQKNSPHSGCAACASKDCCGMHL